MAGKLRPAPKPGKGKFFFQQAAALARALQHRRAAPDGDRPRSDRNAPSGKEDYDLMSRTWKAVAPMTRKVALKPSNKLSDSPMRDHGTGWANMSCQRFR